VQLGINGGRLTFPEMKIDKAPFPVHAIDLSNSKMLIRPEQAEGAKEKKVIIGDKRQITIKGMILVREVVREKTHDGEKTLKISIKARTPGGQEGSSSADRSVAHARPVRPVGVTGRTSLANRSDRPGDQAWTFKPRHSEVGTWKSNQPKL